MAAIGKRVGSLIVALLVGGCPSLWTQHFYGSYRHDMCLRLMGFYLTKSHYAFDVRIYSLIHLFTYLPIYLFHIFKACIMPLPPPSY